MRALIIRSSAWSVDCRWADDCRFDTGGVFRSGGEDDFVYFAMRCGVREGGDFGDVFQVVVDYLGEGEAVGRCLDVCEEQDACTGGVDPEAW